MALQANCPACGAQVIFKTGSSVVVVCEFCHSVVARTDRGVEDAGKVADIVESGSPLEVGLRGVFLGVAFELTGRAQLQHAAGGFWDEWYAAFADGRWGWLAEAQGRFYLTFQIQVPSPNALPSFDSLQLGQQVWAIPAQQPPVVAEKGTARMLAAARLRRARDDARGTRPRARAARGRARGARGNGDAAQLPELRRAARIARARQDRARRVPELRVAPGRESGPPPIPEDARTQGLGHVDTPGRDGRVRGAPVHGHRLHGQERRVRGRALLLAGVPSLQRGGRLPLARRVGRPLELRDPGPAGRGHGVGVAGALRRPRLQDVSGRGRARR